MRKLKNAKYRVGVIGCGSQGTRNARAFDLSPLCEIVAGANRGQEGLDLFCKRFDVPGYNDYRELLRKEKVDIIVSGTPVGVNAQVCVDSARAGVKGIFCEKPIAVSLAEADAMVEEARIRNVALGSGDMFRFNPQFWEARRIVESGEVGEVRSINAYGSGGREMSGTGCRTFTDMAMFARDSEVDWVVGWVNGLPVDVDLGKVDEWSDADQGGGGFIRYKNGIDGFVHQTSLGGKTGVEAICTKGVVCINECREGSVWKMGKGGLKSDRSLFPDPDPAIRNVDSEYDADGWMKNITRLTDAVESFIESVDTGMPVKCSGEDARRALEIAFGFRESHRRGHAPVKFPIPEQPQDGPGRAPQHRAEVPA